MARGVGGVASLSFKISSTQVGDPTNSSPPVPAAAVEGREIYSAIRMAEESADLKAASEAAVAKFQLERVLNQGMFSCVHLSRAEDRAVSWTAALSVTVYMTTKLTICTVDQAGRRTSMVGTVDGQPALLVVEQQGVNSGGKTLSYHATSILRTLGYLWGFEPYNPRVKNAPSFDHLIGTELRTDTPEKFPTVSHFRS
ncbi:hypothetical protein NLG97_g4241 [Lecanicillium saksenae]|uniref:Uncharacterized protein n=1 Tax=Lecanicillium saksenae TaxID=468837 RepID=A0ACC1QXP7_9HYPO|nr:hypothetical protein NLG97_g4241 [Lecanicillium saksenae]